MQKISCIEAAKILGVHRNTIYRLLKNHQLKRANGYKEKNSVYLEDLLAYKSTSDKIYRTSYNKRFFQTQNERSAYWAGFLMADGSLSDENRLKICLCRKDKYLLEEFAKELDYTNGKVKDYVGHYTHNNDKKNITNK